MSINKKTGRIVRSKSLTQKNKAATTRRHNKMLNVAKPRKKRK
jgi:hypothetical protein